MSERTPDPTGERGADDTSGGAAPPLEARDLRKSYRYGEARELRVLQGVDLRIETGEAVAIVGASGSGKSTLLNLLGVLDRPSSGEIWMAGTPVSTLADSDLALTRCRHVGFVFQFHHLLREFTALENVVVPQLIARHATDRAYSRARELLTSVGLEERLEHKPWQLSGGEQQRVAVARALANEPTVLLADEPSGNLDHHTSDALHDTLFRVRAERGLSMVLVTHNRELAERADRILLLEDGVLRAVTSATMSRDPTGPRTAPPAL